MSEMSRLNTIVDWLSYNWPLIFTFLISWAAAPIRLVLKYSLNVVRFMQVSSAAWRMIANKQSTEPISNQHSLNPFTGSDNTKLLQTAAITKSHKLRTSPRTWPTMWRFRRQLDSYQQSNQLCMPSSYAPSWACWRYKSKQTCNITF